MIFSLEVAFNLTFSSPKCFSNVLLGSVNISFRVFSLFKSPSFSLLDSSKSSKFPSRNKIYKEYISLISKGNLELYFLQCIGNSFNVCLGTYLDVGLYLEIRVRNQLPLPLELIDFPLDLIAFVLYSFCWFTLSLSTSSSS